MSSACNAVITAMGPWSLPGSLINFQGYSLERDAVRRAWDPETRLRLDAIEDAWDPNRLFSFGYSHARI